MKPAKRNATTGGAVPVSKARPAKEPKPKKLSDSKKPSAHPSYVEMIREAILTLKDRTGSSQYAIAKFTEEKHKDHLPPNFKKFLLVQLKKLVASGTLVKIKNSFKISSTAKPTASVYASGAPKKPERKQQQPKGSAATPVKKVAVAKPKTAFKKVSKVSTLSIAKKAPARVVKKTKSIKSPAKKATAKLVKRTKSIKSPAKKAKK